MRRSYISPEYRKDYINGTFNMLEESNFFGAKMLEIEDEIMIGLQDIVYYQRDNGEQLDISIESELSPYIYSSSDKIIGDKVINHTLESDKSQSVTQLDSNTRWVITINVMDILSNYLFAILKSSRAFEGIKNDMTIYKNIDIAIKSYIKLNVLSRYAFTSSELYINYKDIRIQNLLKFDNKWSLGIANAQFKLIKYQSDFDGSVLKLTFNQEKPSSSFIFEYYFSLLFSKI